MRIAGSGCRDVAQAFQQATGGSMAERITGVRVIAASLLWLAAGTAAAASYQDEHLNGHLVRCNTINTGMLPEASLAQYGLEADPRQGLLTCLVQKEEHQTGPANVAAEVRARHRPMGQAWREIPMREVEVNGLVSYMGVYPVHPGATLTLRFEVMIDVPRVGGMRLAFDDLDPQR
jgi:nitrate/nitrite transporter NarK